MHFAAVHLVSDGSSLLYKLMNKDVLVLMHCFIIGSAQGYTMMELFSMMF